MHTYYINPLNMVMDCSSVCWITRGYKDSMDIYTVYIYNIYIYILYIYICMYVYIDMYIYIYIHVYSTCQGQIMSVYWVWCLNMGYPQVMAAAVLAEKLVV